MSSKIKVLLIFCMLLVSVLAVPFSRALTLYEYYNTGADFSLNTTTTTWEAQTFTTGASAHTVVGVNLLLTRLSGQYPGTCTLGVRTVDGSGVPTTTELTSATYDCDTVTTDANGAWYGFNFIEYALSTNTKYALVLRVSGVNVRWRTDSTSPSYADGSQYASTNSGASWTPQAFDSLFEVWGNSLYSTTYTTTKSGTFTITTTSSSPLTTTTTEDHGTTTFTMVTTTFSSLASTTTTSSGTRTTTVTTTTSSSLNSTSTTTSGITTFTTVTPTLSSLATTTSGTTLITGGSSTFTVTTPTSTITSNSTSGTLTYITGTTTTKTTSPHVTTQTTTTSGTKTFVTGGVTTTGTTTITSTTWTTSGTTTFVTTSITTSGTSTRTSTTTSTSGTSTSTSNIVIAASTTTYTSTLTVLGDAAFGYGPQENVAGTSPCQAGQQCATSNGADLYGYLSKDTAGNLLLNMRTYSGAAWASTQVASVTQWGIYQGASITSLMPYGGYWWGVVVTQSNGWTGVTFTSIRVTQPTDYTTAPTITVMGQYYKAYWGAAGHTYTPLAAYFTPDDRTYASFSYSSGGTWQIESIEVTGITTGAPTLASWDYAVTWPNAVLWKYMYSYVDSKLYGVTSLVYFNQPSPTKLVTLLDFTNFALPSSVLTSTYSPAGPTVIAYDKEYGALTFSYFNTNSKQSIYVYRNGYFTYQYAFVDPVGGITTDQVDLAISENNHGLILLMGLWSDMHLQYKFSTDMGTTWSAWTPAPSLPSTHFSYYVNLPTIMQPLGYDIGSQGCTFISGIFNGQLASEVMQFQLPYLTLTGTSTRTGISVITMTQTASSNALTSVGVQTVTVTNISNLATDPPLTVMMMALLIMLASLGVPLLLLRTLMATIMGAMLGVVICVAVGLFPIYLLVVTLIGLVLMVFFNRQSG